MKIQHDNKTYTLDPERAIELGVLKPDIKYKVGDVFEYKYHYYNESAKCVIVKTDYESEKYSVIGLNNTLDHYSNILKSSPEEIAEYLMNGGGTKYTYLGNINDSFKELLKNFKG